MELGLMGMESCQWEEVKLEHPIERESSIVLMAFVLKLGPLCGCQFNHCKANEATVPGTLQQFPSVWLVITQRHNDLASGLEDGFG